MKSILYVFFVFLFIGCSNPGYSVRINIDHNAKANESDIQQIQNCFLNTDHEVVMVKKKDFWKIESYKINLKSKRFEQLEHNYINFAVEYHYDQKKTSGKQIIKDIEVRIGNSWEGKNPILKKEIDKVADCVLNQLKGRIGDSYISIDRRYTGPI
jgi:hypothetical protein